VTAQKRGGKAFQKSQTQQSRADDKPAVVFLPPLKPRPKVLIALGILLALWLIALVVMRLAMVHPAPVPHASPVPAIPQ
jgi:hypothetical protein